MNATRAIAAAATIDDPRWQRVLARDISADGEFFYSVSSSGVYCRPSCVSRPAKPEHVAFHLTAKDARRAGFRPCKRCKPDELETGIGETLRYAVTENSLGRALVARSDRGVCAILLGDDAATLKDELRARFPNASLQEDAQGLASLAREASALLEMPATARFEARLDIRGTPFQQQVWQALRGIRPGSAASYTQIAQRIGAPKSARAVAQACAANPLAVVIPCHRVVRGNGALSGYRWGVQRKRALLRREGFAG